MALKLETDPSEILNDMIMALRKGGRMGVVGVYAGECGACCCCYCHGVDHVYVLHANTA